MDFKDEKDVFSKNSPFSNRKHPFYPYNLKHPISKISKLTQFFDSLVLLDYLCHVHCNIFCFFPYKGTFFQFLVF
jgi:hypothetical protein